MVDTSNMKVDWDVKKNDPIDYFDPTLSYELTGYRPINETQGLDFDISGFIETRNIKLDTGVYTSYRPGTKMYNDFWGEQYERCRDGYEYNNYRITGNNYFFLNFYRIQSMEVAVAGESRAIIFPNFFAKQYEYFHYIELCRYTGHDVCALKARGVGFSEIAAGIGINTYTTIRNSLVAYTAFDEKKLSDVLNKCWTQMEFLNSDTEGGMKHLRMKYNSELKKRASIVDKQGNESGFKSEIRGITADKPSKLRGDRVSYLFFEEAGSDPILVKKYLQNKALVELGGRKIGIRLVWGTGGDSGPNLAGLSSIFLNPKGYNILPYKHNYTKTGEYVETGFFIPAYTYIALPGCIDNRGVTDTKKARAYYENERNNLLDDPKSYMIECAEYCFTPDDALALEGDNQFDTNLLQEQLSNIILHKIGPRPVSGFLDYKFKPNTEEKEENICGFRWVPSPNGKIRILEEPELDESGRPYRDLYVAGIDSIDLGQSETASGTTDPSKFSIVIKKRTRGLEPSKYVAMYVDRPKDIREAYKNALKLLQYYNCKAVIEKSKVSLIMFFRDKKMDRKYLMRRPRATLNNKFTGKSNEYGVPATEEFIKHALELIGNYIADNCQEIWFQDMLEDLIKYSYENKRKFDIVASMEMAELGDEDMSGALPTEAIITKDQWKDVGWTKDKKGYIHFGVIEEQKVEPVDLFPNYDDDNRNRTSDPRYN